MTEKPYFERLWDVLEGLERCVYDDENYWGYAVAILDLKYEAIVKDISLDHEQLSYVREKALEHLKMGIKSRFLSLCSILASTASKEVESIETSLTHHFDYKEGHSNQYEIAIRLLLDAGVFESGEKIMYYDIGMVGFQKKDIGRTGLIILTDRRVVVVGGYARLGLSSKKHKPFYGEMRDPFLSTVDFIRLDRVTDIELEKKEIKMKYDTEYIVEKDRTFYGPYFFKFDLPTSINVKSGSIKVFITLAEMIEKSSTHSNEDTHMDQVFSLWDKVEVPKDYDKNRLRAFYNRLSERLHV